MIDLECYLTIYTHSVLFMIFFSSGGRSIQPAQVEGGLVGVVGGGDGAISFTRKRCPVSYR